MSLGLRSNTPHFCGWFLALPVFACCTIQGHATRGTGLRSVLLCKGGAPHTAENEPSNFFIPQAGKGFAKCAKIWEDLAEGFFLSGTTTAARRLG